ncbi:MAG TPA: hypothetical protein VKU00_01335, partial [Chthonomonadaceae bacterium]|nr:hypothetical protein [Chthonomonadaceae bacterium]
MTQTASSKQKDIAGLEARLQILDKEKLSLLLKSLAANHPELIPEIQAEATKLFAVTGKSAASGVTSPPPAAMDITKIRKQIRVAIKAGLSQGESYSYYDDGDSWEDLE